MFNKESDFHFSDESLESKGNSFDSAFSDKGPELGSAFQEEKAEKRHFFLPLALPLILLSVSCISAFLSWYYMPVILYLAVIVACFVLSIIILGTGLKRGRFICAAIVVALIGLSFFATLGGSVYRGVMKKDSLIHQGRQSNPEENKPDSDDPKDYENESADYNWTEEDFENLKPKKDTLRSIIKRHGKANYVEMESSGLKVEYSRGDEKEYINLTFVKNKEGQYVYDGGTATYPVDGVTEVDNYSSDWTIEQLNRLRTKDQEIFGPATPLSEVVREHSQADSAQRRISVHSSGVMNKTVDLAYTDQNSSIEKAKFLKLSFEYNEKKKDYYLSYNSASRYSW